MGRFYGTKHIFTMRQINRWSQITKEIVFEFLSQPFKYVFVIIV